jgi:3'(2'), 5'-bisphosphate nucleotidase
MGDHEDAHRIATEAGALLLGIRAEAAAGRLDPSQLRDEGDRRSNELILELLHQAHPNDAVLSEERADDPSRINAARAWIVDPLDGTREFGEDPRWDWAVHVALVEKGFPTAAAVALPARGLTLSTLDPPQLPPPVDRPPVLVVSRTRPPAETEMVRAALGGDLLPMGSAGAKAMAVVQGAVDAYVHAGGQYEWDSAAPAAVAETAGLHVSRLDGRPLAYNQPDPWLPDLLVCRPELAADVIAAARA